MTLKKVRSIRRYPVKSMMGEELNACEIGEKGLVGDRAFGIIDNSTGKLANAKNPLKWPDMFQYRAAFTEPFISAKGNATVRITLPNGETVLSSHSEKDSILSESFGKSVRLASPSQENVQFEGYIPQEITELEDRGTIFTRQSPSETFFDIAFVHLITTATIDELRRIAPESRIEARRFRPNIIIDVPDEEGFVENNWIGKTLKIGDNVQLEILQGTKRCVMTTLAQDDLPRDTNVLRSIVKHNDGNFGVYAKVVSGGMIKVNDEMTIV